MNNRCITTHNQAASASHFYETRICACPTCFTNLLLAFIVSVLSFSGCKSDETKTESAAEAVTDQQQVDPKQEFAKLNSFLKRFDEPSQIFNAPAGKLIKVTGKNGTTITIDPADLETEAGNPIGNFVEIELKELSNREQLLRANAQTVSDGDLLITGGAYYINAMSEGHQLKLKTGKSYSVEFPKVSDDKMNLYYGMRDSMNQMNWKPADKKLSEKNPLLGKNESDSVASPVAQIISYVTRDSTSVPIKPLTKEERKKIDEQNRIVSKVYNQIALNQFGWFNCDMQLIPNPPRTQVQYVINNKTDEVDFANVYLIFKDQKALMSSSYGNYSDKIRKTDFNNVPVGWTAKFLAVSYHNQKNICSAY